ncbi:beta-ketoacyl synthase N-terminal-like domain-containing protein [Montanilutibacter psychrotolerans]|uniref:Beta-ketoacyl synthase n=1 Tax=Montanilutibacter psychrotolerans TaxID=1327343 RepID=A0A3M8T1K9_9GAMM|nr:beta-ketoacyl synthase N-terminal-like domain-containing protein [Lysobacter psychrotolerans]RNF85404.1 beta-ketoacyl synthase [Lysobacter psychrotolerans]
MRPEMPAIALTGIGAVLPSGLGHEALWSDWQQSPPTLGRFAHPLLRTSRIVAYGAVPEDARAASRDAVPFKLRRYGTDPSHWAVHAAGQAIADAAIAWDDLPEDRRGLFSGQGDYSHPDIGSLRASVQAARQPGGKLDYRVLARQALYRRGADPFISIKALANNALALTSLTYRCRGVGCAFVQNEAAGIAALRRALFELTHHRCDAALVIACGSYAEPITLAELWQRGLLGDADAVPEVLAGFDAGARGSVLGEGAVALLLERTDDVHARGGRVRAVLHSARGHAARNPRPERVSDADEGTGHAALLAHLPTLAGTSAVLADGRGHVALDSREANQLARHLPTGTAVSSLRASTGVVPAAGALADVAMAAQVLGHDLLPPIRGLVDPVVSDGRVDWVTGPARAQRFDHVLCMQQGYSGFSSAVTVSRAA